MEKSSRDLLVLKDQRIIETIAILQHRINERFPNSGLSNLCGQLLGVAKQASNRSNWISRPIISIRCSGYFLAISLLAMIVAVVLWIRKGEVGDMSLEEIVPFVEAGLNIVIFIAIAIYFLISFESRIKRRRALTAVHELRAIAHIIDMHQLTKDPERVLGNWNRTEHSPKQTMTPFQLNRYLDYCSEMLALTGKIAALYVQQFDDSESVAAVSELEQLSTGLSRKIWQKLMIARTISAELETRQEVIELSEILAVDDSQGSSSEEESLHASGGQQDAKVEG